MCFAKTKKCPGEGTVIKKNFKISCSRHNSDKHDSMMNQLNAQMVNNLLRYFSIKTTDKAGTPAKRGIVTGVM
jgi:hypothetical protein